MRSTRLISVLLILFPLLAGSQSQDAQPQGAGAQSPTVLRTTTNLVVVDVVATDNQGRPISDLKQEDFTVSEDGVPQRLSGFSFQKPSLTRSPVRSLPPNVVSNASEYSGASSLNVILLDAINTDFSSHAYAQEMLIKYLDTNPAIQPTAIYALDGKLLLLHDFTTDTKALRDALAHFKPLGPTHIADVYTAASPFQVKGSFQAGPHARQITFQSMDFLAQVLAGYPGRKNLIWLSEGFPLNLFPDTLLDQGEGMVIEDYSPIVEKIADELMNAQVAVYPIDAAGVSKDDRFPAHTAMLSISERTGGKTFYNRNDIEVGVKTSIDDGSTYYTLSYYPQNRNWNGKFRKIEVKVNQRAASLQYRRGYYALRPNVTGQEAENTVATAFSQALVLTAPASTSVQFLASIVPPSKETQNKYVVNFGVDPHTLAFELKNDGLEHASVTCVVWAYPSKGDPVRFEGSPANANLKPEVYEQVMKSYFPCHRPIDLKKGDYTLRLGVLDRTTNLMGTVTMKFSMP